ncbi:ABC transporter permease family protein [Halopelagius longus]|uniref:ABC transporter permease n=1 Tax=Halopelagius longus TaxID=1236180 RepID=A0A1H1AVN3_9EURY|nr:ABC transporter permease [Halopelagius longus]RDI70530.1 ABC transporter permease [Halopelagius longus]SDQ43591.1 ABC-type transport system permease protein [Halopelagius longus]
MKRDIQDHLRAVARIARWEVSRSAGTIDRRTAVLGLVALLLAGSVAGAGVLTGGVEIDRGIYRVGVAPENPYYEPVAASSALDPRPPDARALENGDIDLLVAGDTFYAADSQKGRAALSTTRSVVQRYNDGLMLREENRTAAFPVVVTLRYLDRSTPLTSGGDAGGATGGAGTGGGGEGSSGGGDDSDATGGTDEGTAGGDGSAAGGSGSPSDDGRLRVPEVGGANPLSSGSTGSPAAIQPPFPFASLVLAFAFLVPMNFVVQAYGSTMLNERINRRGELLLVAPVSPGDIVAGKTLPYFGLMVGLTSLIAVGVGGGALSVAAVLPVALTFLAATFVGAMFARSFKELTFVTVAASVFLTSYAFVPAIFANVTPIALISPLTLVVRDLQPAGVVGLGEYVFSTGPFYLCSGVLFLLGAGVYREEDMFTQRPVPLKFLDALDARISRPRDVAVLSALSIPFVFVAELLAIAVLFALPVEATVPVLLLLVAVVEEFAKSVHVYAAFEKSRFERAAGTALRVGALSGLGFFVGEKFTAVAQAVALPELVLGQATLAPSGVGAFSGIGVLSAVGLFLAPLVLHVVTAGLTALGASRDGRSYAASFVVAVLLHTAYNLTVVNALG